MSNSAVGGILGSAQNPLATLAGSSNALKNQGLDKDMFLKLMITQLQNQDPTKPMDSTAFASQLAQFSSLEQMATMNQNMAGLVAFSAANEAIAMIGKTVGYKDPLTGQISAGQVTQVKLVGGTPTLLVNGASVEIGSITNVM